MKCNNCGQDITENTNFCNHCGARVEMTGAMNAGVTQSIENTPVKVVTDFEIKGGSFPIVEFNLKAGDKIISEAGAMAWKDPSITMDTTSDGGFKKVIGRLFTGEKLFHNIYTATRDNTKISFASCVPGTIRAVEIKDGQSLICQKPSFLLAVGDVELSVFFNKKLGAGIFGGEGFLMQKVSGNGIVFIEIDGSSYEYELGVNERFIVSTGHLVSMSETCSIDIEMVSGAKNIFLGGEGLFNTVIKPGRVTVQTMPIAKLARSINPYIVHPERSSSNDSAASIITGIIGRNK